MVSGLRSHGAEGQYSSKASFQMACVVHFRKNLESEQTPADDQRKSDHREQRIQVSRVLPKQYSLLPIRSILHKYHEKVVEYM